MTAELKPNCDEEAFRRAQGKGAADIWGYIDS